MPKGYVCKKKIAGYTPVVDENGNKTGKVLCGSFDKDITHLVKATAEKMRNKDLVQGV